MIISGTGHRPKDIPNGYSLVTFNKLIDAATKALDIIRPEKVISGMALGWDQALAIASHRLSIPLVAAVPFPGQELQWPEDSQKLYGRILVKACEVKYVYNARPNDYRDVARLMNVRNTWMVDNSNLILALWSGKQTGGTANCISYAASRHKPVVNAWKFFRGEQTTDELKAAFEALSIS